MQHPLGPSLILASSMVDRSVAPRFLSHCQHPSMPVEFLFSAPLPSMLPLELPWLQYSQSDLSMEGLVFPGATLNKEMGTEGQMLCLLFSRWSFLRFSACFSGGLSGIANVLFHCFFFLSCVPGSAPSLLLPLIISQINLLHSSSCSRLCLGKTKQEQKLYNG